MHDHFLGACIYLKKNFNFFTKIKINKNKIKTFLERACSPQFQKAFVKIE